MDDSEARGMHSGSEGVDDSGSEGVDDSGSEGVDDSGRVRGGL